MAVNQRRVCQVEDLPMPLSSQSGRIFNPRRVLVTERTSEASPTLKKTSRLIRRETASRLLDLAQNPSPVFKPAEVAVPKSNKAPSPRLAKTTSWKSSKFFSRTMTSAEMLKGLKKLSVSSSSPAAGPAEVKRSTTDSWKLAKNRLCAARRKTAAGESVTISITEGETSSGSAGNEQSNCLLGDAVAPQTILRKKSEDEGIVCKKEDLMSLIRKASKQGSPKTRRASLKSASSSNLEPVSKQSMEDEAVEEVKDPVRRSSFETVKNKLKSTFSGGSSSSDAKATSDLSSLPLEAEASVVVVTYESEESSMEDSSLEPLVAEDKAEATKAEKVSEQEDDSKVEWDDGSFVNPMLLGGAIEAFLKGMGGTAPTEKRVSFKKT